MGARRMTIVTIARIGILIIMTGVGLNGPVMLGYWPVGWATIVGCWLILVGLWVTYEALLDAERSLKKAELHFRAPTPDDYEWVTEQMAARAQQRHTK
jgi:hypothetical protein